MVAFCASEPEQRIPSLWGNENTYYEIAQSREDLRNEIIYKCKVHMLVASQGNRAWTESEVSIALALEAKTDLSLHVACDMFTPTLDACENVDWRGGRQWHQAAVPSNPDYADWLR